MNNSYDDALLSEEVIRALEFETKLEFAANFYELYLAPLQEAVTKPLTKKTLETFKHLGHKLSGHAEFPQFIPIGDTLESQSLTMLKSGKSDISVFVKLIEEIKNIYNTEVIPFNEQNK